MTPRQMLVFMLETRENLDQQIQTLQTAIANHERALIADDDDKSGGVKTLAIATARGRAQLAVPVPGEFVSDDEWADIEREELQRLGVRVPRH